MIDQVDEEAVSVTMKNDPKFEKILKEYKKVIQELKLRCLEKYGNRAIDWFGI